MSSNDGAVQRTVLYEKHVEAKAKIVDFAGWEMPIQYPAGIVNEHLATRKKAGMFDVSHMGRFIFKGEGALAFLQYVLSNDAAALSVGEAQYTMIPTATGGAVDDAYLYKFVDGEFLLVVNASNKQKDWDHFEQFIGDYDVEMVDVSDEYAMISVQGPESEAVLEAAKDAGEMPEPQRNLLGTMTFAGAEVLVSRTGYAGEPIGFELFVPSAAAGDVWDKMLEAGAEPIGLGARDTLRLEAALPLYGHELGTDEYGQEIPVFAIPLAKFAVSFDEAKGDFIGKAELMKQAEASAKIVKKDFSPIADLPRRVKPVVVTGKGIVRAGAKVFVGDKEVGYVTSGTMVPYFVPETVGEEVRNTEESAMRSIGLALLDSDIFKGAEVEFDVRGRRVAGVVVLKHVNNRTRPCVTAVVHEG